MLRAPTLLLLALSVPALSFAGRATFVAAACALGGEFGDAVAALGALPARPSPSSSGLPDPDVVSCAGDAFEGDTSRFVSGADGRPRRGTPTARPSKRRPAHGVFVGQGVVLRIARSGVVPSGRPVDATGARSAGVEFAGVSVLGVGVHDGDVLTEVAGRAVRSEGQVVGAVLAVRARRAPSISAVFYRGTERWSLVVEMPYPPGS